MNAAGAESRAERTSLLHKDFIIHEAGGLPFSGDYRGASGFFELMARMTDVLTFTPGPISLHEVGKVNVVARFRLAFTSRASGQSVETNVVEFYTVRDGLIAELDVYYKDPSAVAGLLT